MKRQSARDDVDGVDPYIVTVAGEPRGKRLRGSGNTAQAVSVERHRRAIGGGALLDLDKGQHASAPRDEVNLSATHFHAASKDSPAVQAEPPGGERLGASTAPFGFLPVQSKLARCKARA